MAADLPPVLRQPTVRRYSKVFPRHGALLQTLRAMIGPVGGRLAHLFVEVWDAAGEEHPILVPLRVAGTDEGAARHLVSLLNERLLLWPALVARYGREVAVENAEARGAFVPSHLLGLALTRYVLKLDALAAMPADKVAAIYGPVLQRLLEPTLLSEAAG